MQTKKRMKARKKKFWQLSGIALPRVEYYAQKFIFIFLKFLIQVAIFTYLYSLLEPRLLRIILLENSTRLQK